MCLNLFVIYCQQKIKCVINFLLKYEEITLSDQGFEQFVDSVIESIKEKRRAQGLTQGELGEILGKPQSAIARFEAGKVRDPRISMFYQICSGLKINPADVMRNAFLEQSGVKEMSREKRMKDIKKRLDDLDSSEKSVVMAVLDNLFKLL